MNASEIRRDVVPVADHDHLDADVDEDDRQAVVEVAEAVLHAGQQEVQRAQTEDGEGVRGEHDELLAADGQDGRHRVDGEHHVGGLDQTSTANSGVARRLPFSLREQLLAVVLGVDGTTRRTSSSTGLFSGWTRPRRACATSRMPVKIRKAPKTNSSH